MPITLGDPLSFDNLGGGAAAEKVEHALKQVLENILDPNTHWGAPREIILKIKIKPTSDERADANVIIDCQAKLAPAKSFPTRIFIGKDIQGHPEAHEINANQYDLFPKQKENITNIGG
jgi:hypothetical protein